MRIMLYPFPPPRLNFVHTAYFVMNNTLLSKINQGSPGGRRNESLATSTLPGTWRNSSFLFHHHLEKFLFPSIQNNLRKIVIFNLLATGKTPFTYRSILSLFQFNYGFMFARYQEKIGFFIRSDFYTIFFEKICRKVNLASHILYIYPWALFDFCLFYEQNER